MYTLLESTYTKLAVHWAPWVSVWTPGWMAAVEAGAHDGALRAGAIDAIPANTIKATPRRAARERRRSGRMNATYSHSPLRNSAPERFLTGLSGDVQQYAGGTHGDHK